MVGGISLRAHPSAHRQHGRLPDPRARRLALARGAATWVRRLGYIALGAVITQGILGGITVLWYLPDPISIAHASLAQIVFCLTIDDRAGDVARMEARVRPGTPDLVPDRSDRCSSIAIGDDGPRLCADPASARRCGTRMRGWRFRTSRSRSAI